MERKDAREDRGEDADEKATSLHEGYQSGGFATALLKKRGAGLPRPHEYDSPKIR